jgi:hypothetical protein
MRREAEENEMEDISPGRRTVQIRIPKEIYFQLRELAEESAGEPSEEARRACVLYLTGLNRWPPKKKQEDESKN